MTLVVLFYIFYNSWNLAILDLPFVYSVIALILPGALCGAAAAYDATELRQADIDSHESTRLNHA